VFKYSIALFVISLVAWLESPDAVARAGVLALPALVLFVIFSAVLTRLSNNKLSAVQAAVVSFNSFSVFFFMVTLSLAVIGFLPARLLANSLLLSAVIVFASVVFSSYVLLSGVRKLDENASVWLLSFLFLCLFVLTILTLYLFSSNLFYGENELF
jgi:hypothetical protein